MSCDKIGYTTFKEAQTVVNRAKHPRSNQIGRKGPRRHSRGSDKVPIRSYKCDECGLYHLTSKRSKYGK